MVSFGSSYLPVVVLLVLLVLPVVFVCDERLRRAGDAIARLLRRRRRRPLRWFDMSMAPLGLGAGSDYRVARAVHTAPLPRVARAVMVSGPAVLLTKRRTVNDPLGARVTLVPEASLTPARDSL